MNSDALKKMLQWVYDLMDDELQSFITVVGEYFDGICKTIETIESQIFPEEATVSGSLTDFERFYKCYPISGDTVAIRRSRVIAAIRARGGLNVSFFNALATALGYTVSSSGTKHLTITEGYYAPFRADYGRADIDSVYDQGSNSSMFIVTVTGTNVETDSDLQYRFDKQRCCGISFEYVND